jgi:hypothetical protein
MIMYGVCYRIFWMKRSDLGRARPGTNPEGNPLAQLWENSGEGFDGTILFHEHVVADVNLGGHETVCKDMTRHFNPDNI